MNEKITIKNFGGLDEVTIPLNSINIFIGKQASGKSVSAKLIFFFKGLFSHIFFSRLNNRTLDQIHDSIFEKFVSYFPFETWKDEEFEIDYQIGENSIYLLKKLNSDLQLMFTNPIADLFSKEYNLDNIIDTKNYFYKSTRENFGELSANSQVFVPAGRSFFATLQNSIYSILSENETIDPFIIEFGRFYSQTRNISEYNLQDKESDKYIQKLIAQILVGKHKRENDKDYIIHKDKRKIELSFASSGQQEVLPLAIIFEKYNKVMHRSGGTTFYIEEPEAHLFPSAQKSIVELIAAVYNNSIGNLQFVITTHSPYILSAFNNLLQAGHLRDEGKNEKEIEKIVSKFSIIKPKELNAFEMRDGKLINLIDEEFGLITATTLDKASEDISKEFDALLNLD